MGVLTNFDFLDDELDSREDDLGGFGWGTELGRRGSFEASGESGEKTTHLGGSLSGSETDLTMQDLSDEDDEVGRSPMFFNSFCKRVFLQYVLLFCKIIQRFFLSHTTASPLTSLSCPRYLYSVFNR